MDANITLIAVWKLGQSSASHVEYFYKNINGGTDAAVKVCCVSNLLNWANQFSYICVQRNRGILLGVVGTDVPVSELLKTIPKYKVPHPARD